MARKSFKFGFRNCTPQETLAKCEQFLGGVARLPADSYEPEFLADAKETVADLRASQERIASLRAELRAEMSRHKELLRSSREKTSRAVNSVSVKCSSDMEKMSAVGVPFEASKTVRVGKPGAIESFRIETNEEGTLTLRWKLPLRRKVFELQMCPDPLHDAGWKTIEVVGAQKKVLRDVTSGVKNWYRVRGINSNGQGPWSNPVSARAR